jgi:asparagine synthase (glutamine-hydrolysing)
MEQIQSPAERFEHTHVKGEVNLYRFYKDTARDAFFQEFEDCRKDSSDLEAMLRFDRKFFLAGLLNIDDKLCGRHSLEGRPSYLNQKLVRHVVNVEQEQLLPGRDLKPILRKLAETDLPQSIIEREDKMGFTTPIGDFVNKSAHLIRERVLSSKYLDFYNLDRMNFTAETKFSREVFGLLTLDLWLNKNMAA